MKSINWTAAAISCLMVVAVTATAQVAEVVPTSRARPAAWRYTVEAPAGNEWTRTDFNDSNWQTGGAPFGTAGTPGITANTRWATPDIWMRREITLPASGFTPASLQLLVCHDEDVEIYFDGIVAARQGGFVTEYQPIEILPDARRLLKPSAKILISVHCIQRVGGQGIDVGLATVSEAWLSARRKDAYRGFALSNSGDAAAGRKLFLDEHRLACARCHTTDGTSGRAAPDLMTIGDKYPRGELINAILNPSASIAVGYETTIVNTKSGDTLVGVLKQVSNESIGVMAADGKLQQVPVAQVRSRRTQNGSLMPEGLEIGITQSEFADLIEYLVSLRLPEMADAGRQGMPSQIETLQPPVSLIPIHRTEDHFEHPCWFGQIPGEPGTFLVCEHETGHVWRLSADSPSDRKTMWGDFSREIRRGGATGLLGLAFHPQFREIHKYYIQHQLIVDGRLVARVSEKIAAPDLLRDSGQPSRTIIEFACSTDVHSGGGIQFGPDGYLYIGMGDTGPQGDPQGHGQDLKTMLGKMLRIDVDGEDAGKSYAIPADNPFRSRNSARPEIWAYGFREPWRFSFDSENGDLWVGDVGQDRIEEVGIVRSGENHGWNVYEGFDLFSSRYRTTGVTCVPPVFAYNRKLGNSITGGFVYRGSENSPFNGVYICGDFNSKRVWGLKQTDRKLTTIWQLCTSPQSIASFGRDEAGALYLVGYEGTIYKLDFTAAATSLAAAHEPKRAASLEQKSDLKQENP